MKVWKNITLNLPEHDLSLVSEQLSDLDIASITIKDKRNEIESDWFEDTENPTTLNGDTHNIVLLIHGDTIVNDLLSKIRLKLNLDYSPDYTEEIFEDKDWTTYTQSQFSAIQISESLRIVPPWGAHSPFDGESIIIQPGSGFGTGTHPTTQLCLKWMESNVKGGESVLDYGCGSGILSITATKLGAGSVKGIEIDPQAIHNANRNNELNQTTIPFIHADNYKPKEKYQIVIANILLSVLIRLASKLSDITGKKLVLSGILENQTSEIQEAFDPWIQLKLKDEMDGWVLLEGSL